MCLPCVFHFRSINWTLAKDRQGFSVLHRAVLQNRLDLISTIQQAGVFGDLYNEPVSNDQSSYHNKTAAVLAQDCRLYPICNELTRCLTLETSLTWLHKLARSGDTKKVQILSNKHPYLLEKEASDQTIPLFWAVISGCFDTVKLLVSLGSDTFCRSQNGDTLLTVAVVMGHKHLIPYLINTCDLDPDIVGSQQMTALCHAVDSADMDMLRCLVECDTSIYDACLPQMAKKDNVEMLLFAMSKFNLDINYQDKQGRTALFRALQFNNVHIAKILLANGADLKMKDRQHRTLLHAAVEGGQASTLECIIEELKRQNCLYDLIDMRDRYIGGDRCFLVRGKDQGLLAYHFVEVDRLKIHNFRAITRSGGSLDVAKYGNVIRSGWGALPSEEVQKSIDNRYDACHVNSDTPQDMTALCLAIMKEKPECALLLIENECDVNEGDKFGLSPAHLACMTGQLGVLTRLEQAGADINSSDKYYRTPLEAAEQNGHRAIVNYINSSTFTYSNGNLIRVRFEHKFALVTLFHLYELK